MSVKQKLDELFAQGQSAHSRADYTATRRIGSELYDLARQHEDHMGMARGHNLLGSSFLHAAADGQTAERYYRSALDHYRLAGDRRGEAIVNLNLGSLALDINLDLDEARRHYEQSLPVFREIGDNVLIAIGVSNLAEIYRLEGDYQRAYDFGKEALKLFEDLGETSRVGWQLVNIAHYHLLRGESRLVIETQRRAFELLLPEQNPEQLANYFEIWFYLACQLNAYPSAARILGFLEKYRQDEHMPRLALYMPWFTPRYEKLQKSISYDALMQYREEGEKMSVSEAHIYITNALTDAIA